MDDPRPEKVAVVDEVRDRLAGAEAAILTEYRGLSVAELAQLRTALAAAGGDYKVYKNTLVRLAVAGGPHEPLSELLSGPTAIAFVSGEVSAVAKALRDFSRSYPALVLKGGQHTEGLLSSADLVALADLPPRDVLLARVAGAIAAPLQQFAGLLQALPRNLAYGLSALVDQRGGPPGEASDADAEADADATGTSPAAEVEAVSTEPGQSDGADPAGDGAESTTDPGEEA
jgi:large subunit ribosomal protein L10